MLDSENAAACKVRLSRGQANVIILHKGWKSQPFPRNYLGELRAVSGPEKDADLGHRPAEVPGVWGSALRMPGSLRGEQTVDGQDDAQGGQLLRAVMEFQRQTILSRLRTAGCEDCAAEGEFIAAASQEA